MRCAFRCTHLEELAVEVKVLRRSRAVHVVPPVAHDVFLVKYGSLRTQEVVLGVAWLTHVENLFICPPEWSVLHIIGRHAEEELLNDSYLDNLPLQVCFFFYVNIKKRSTEHIKQFDITILHPLARALSYCSPGTLSPNQHSSPTLVPHIWNWFVVVTSGLGNPDLAFLNVKQRSYAIRKNPYPFNTPLCLSLICRQHSNINALTLIFNTSLSRPTLFLHSYS